MKEYLSILSRLLEEGNERGDRTGTGTYSLFGERLRFDLTKGFPVVTTKKMHLRSIIYELLWFLRGDTNIKFLNENGVTIWDEWADADGNLGPVYGKQWRSWEGPDGKVIDQIARVINEIKTNPESRRLVVSAWNPAEVDQMALPPCHLLFQFYVHDGRLSCQMYQRSADFFLGVPFNIVSYSLLTEMVAAVCGLQAYEFVHVFGDTHLYKNHVEQAKTQLSRDPYPLPTLRFKEIPESIDQFRFEDIVIDNYQSHPTIKAPIAV